MRLPIIEDQRPSVVGPKGSEQQYERGIDCESDIHVADLAMRLTTQVARKVLEHILEILLATRAFFGSEIDQG